ncbi:2-dehydropantoate 2-reductase N-terminal domain-containing protein [Salinicoccus sp. HZC-1]|uniref:2-dehydropantoate 2-reductase N-terminal domain-containing protein n=1 Tax=Salinicoccus sp. HZC-1 TaxID=3385497 RepID=UPI00398B8B07
MKIAVIGIGAVGSIIARELKQTGHDITLFGRTERQGFTILEHGEKTNYPYIIENIHAYDHHPFDIIFISTKATALKGLSKVTAGLCHSGTEIVLCQNGMGYDGWFEGSLPAVVYISGQKHEDMVEHFQDSRLIVDDQNYNYLDPLIEDIKTTELEIIKTDDFEKLRYEKLLINLGINTLTGLSQNTAKIFDKENVTELTAELLEEGIRIVNQDKEIIDSDFKNTALNIYKNYNREMGTSMYYDVTAQKSTEFEFIQKYLHNHKGNVNTPVLDICVVLLEAYEYERNKR